jgi:hypothetical protein
MADVLSHSPEAVYATKGNIVAQKAYSGPRTVTNLADDAPTANAPSAESTTEDHLPSGVGIVNAAFTVAAGDGGTSGV